MSLTVEDIRAVAKWHGSLGQGAVAELCDFALSQITPDDPHNPQNTVDLIRDLTAALAWCATTSARQERSWPHIAQPALDRARDFLKGSTEAPPRP